MSDSKTAHVKILDESKTAGVVIKEILQNARRNAFQMTSKNKVAIVKIIADHNILFLIEGL